MSANSLVQISPGVAAAERCRPYIDKARDSFLEACKKIGAEYAALADDQKAVFRAELRLSDSTVKSYAQIALKADAKLEVIQGPAGGPPAIPPSVEVWKEIVTADDKTLKTAAKAGLFTDYEVNRDTIRTFKRTGQLPAVKKTEREAPTPVTQIRAQLQQAEKALNTAIGHLSRALDLAEQNEVTRITGPEVRMVHKRFQQLCATIATSNPDLVENAVKVLRGEV